MRVTAKFLKARIGILNHLTGNPLDYCTTNEDGSFKAANVGHYCLSQAYGGYALEQVGNEGGGVRQIGNTGHIPARELLLVIDGMIDVLQYELRGKGIDLTKKERIDT